MNFKREFFPPISTLNPDPDKLYLGFDQKAAREYQRFAMKWDAHHERYYTVPGDQFRKPTHWDEWPYDRESI